MLWSTDEGVNEILSRNRMSSEDFQKKYNELFCEPKPKQIGGEHYQLPIEPIDYIVKNELGYREGNVVKYVTRHKNKNGAEDIKKAIHYLEMILKDYDDK